MKMLAVSLCAITLLFNELSLCAGEPLVIGTIAQSHSLISETSFENIEMRQSMLGTDELLYSRKASETYPTSNIKYQYTTDGWLQHVGVYSDCAIFTNVAGPREGVQFIMANNGALIDMCHSYTIHKKYFVNKYPWGEIRTYNNYQIIEIK